MHYHQESPLIKAGNSGPQMHGVKTTKKRHNVCLNITPLEKAGQAGTRRKPLSVAVKDLKGTGSGRRL